jgi:putative hydrolase of the HAD superfamily
MKPRFYNPTAGSVHSLSMASPSLQPITDVLDWGRVDTVLLDMDGTLLDQGFDNYFWQQLVPERFAARQQLSLQQALTQLTPRFTAKQGTLDWYCTDYWSRELGLDIAAMKREVGSRVSFLPGAQQFLTQLRARGLYVVLVTNAHQDSLSVKAQQTGLHQYFHSTVCAHQYGVPKEHREFWPKLQAQLQFDRGRAVMIDDNLAVLRAAREYGIAQVVAVTQPDSALPARPVHEFPCTAAVIDLL